MLFRSVCSDTPVPMSTPSSQILVSRYHYPVKELGLLGEMADSKGGGEKVQDETGISYCDR